MLFLSTLSWWCARSYPERPESVRIHRMKDLKECRPKRLKQLKNVRVLVSFYAAREDGNVSNELVHEEKIFDLNEFKSHVISFTDIKTVAVQKRIGQSIDINIACASKKKFKVA